MFFLGDLGGRTVGGRTAVRFVAASFGGSGICVVAGAGTSNRVWIAMATG